MLFCRVTSGPPPPTLQGHGHRMANSNHDHEAATTGACLNFPPHSGEVCCKQCDLNMPMLAFFATATHTNRVQVIHYFSAGQSRGGTARQLLSASRCTLFVFGYSHTPSENRVPSLHASYLRPSTSSFLAALGFGPSVVL